MVAYQAGRIEIFVVHGIFTVECCGIVFVITDMVCKIIGTNQKIVVCGIAGIPGGVQIVVQIVEFCDIPAVRSAAVAGDQTGVNTQLQRQTVEQQGITLADGGTVHQCGIGGILQVIAVVVQIGIIVCDICADVIVDGLKLGVVAGGGDVQGGQKIVDLSGQRIFLGGGGIVVKFKGQLISVFVVDVAAV